MKQLKTIQLLLTLAAFEFWVAGCATQNVNPPQSRVNTGYVDFRAAPASELWWDVARFDEGTQSFRSVFSQMKPPQDGVLRLAFAPGHHRLQVTFLNRVIRKSAEVEVEVLDGKITPVRVILTAAGTAQVETQSESFGSTAKGRYGRRTKYSSDQSVMYDLSAMAEPPMAYKLKERMPYAH
jgi:hypothetical protein